MGISKIYVSTKSSKISYSTYKRKVRPIDSVIFIDLIISTKILRKLKYKKELKLKSANKIFIIDE